MKNKLNIKTKERMIHVTDDWHPCFEGGFVHCRVSLNYFNGYYVLLNAWGADDTGVEIFKRCSYKASAYKAYENMVRFFNAIPNEIDREWFLNHGFTPA